MKKYPISRKDNLVVQKIDNEIMIYDLIDNKAFCLNETSAMVWQLCDGEKSPLEMSKILSDKIGSKANEDLVWFAVDQLKKENLIENGNEQTSPFSGMNRRDIIKKVGLTTMIALPFVASLAAPQSVMAASCGPIQNGQPNSGACPPSGLNLTCISCCCNGIGTCAAFGGLANGLPCVTNCRCASGMCVGGGIMTCRS